MEKKKERFYTEYLFEWKSDENRVGNWGVDWKWDIEVDGEIVHLFVKLQFSIVFLLTSIYLLV